VRVLNIALIGCGAMGKYHSYAFKIVNHFFDLSIIPKLKIMVDSDPSKEKEAFQYGFEKFSTNIKDVFTDNIDVVDILTPNYLHADLIKKAAQNGKIIICEKPMAMTYKEAKDSIIEVKKNNVLHCINFNYRKATPLAIIKNIIDEGEIGKVYTWKVDILLDSLSCKDTPASWRLEKKFSGGGASHDLLIHFIDLANYLIGKIESVASVEKTFIERRKSSDKKNTIIIDTDDYSACLVNFNCGALGIFDSSRIATGDRIQNTLEIRGSEGAIKWDYQKFNFVNLYLQKDNYKLNGFKKVYTTENDHPYMHGYYKFPGHGHHYNSLIVHQIYDFLKAIEKNQMPSPNLYDGLEAQKVLEAVKISAQEKRWVNINEID